MMVQMEQKQLIWEVNYGGEEKEWWCVAICMNKWLTS